MDLSVNHLNMESVNAERHFSGKMVLKAEASGFKPFFSSFFCYLTVCEILRVE